MFSETRWHFTVVRKHSRSTMTFLKQAARRIKTCFEFWNSHMRRESRERAWRSVFRKHYWNVIKKWLSTTGRACTPWTRPAGARFPAAPGRREGPRETVADLYPNIWSVALPRHRREIHFRGDRATPVPAALS